MLGFAHKSVFEKYSSISGDHLYAIFRITVGFLFFVHGAQKMLGWFTVKPTAPLFSMIGFAGSLELLGGLLIMLGLFTRLAALASALIMFSAGYIAHIMPMVFKGWSVMAQVHWMIQGALLSVIIVGLFWGLTSKWAAWFGIALVLTFTGVIPFVIVNGLALITSIEPVSFTEINPVVNKGELAIMYLVSFLVLLEFGARKWSVEKYLFEKEYF